MANYRRIFLDGYSYYITIVTHGHNQLLIENIRYYEHTIRNERDMDEKMEYIRNNTLKHGLVDVWSDWKYSSFA